MPEPEFIDMSAYVDRDLPSETERAWAAGFFDGEGWIGAHSTKDYTYRKISVVQTKSTETLERFNSAIGDVGRIYARSRRQPEHWAQGWCLQVNAVSRVVFAINLLWPYLSRPKRDQAISAFAVRAAYRASWPAGFKLPQQRLSENDIRDIRRMCGEGVKRQVIAEKFGIHVASVYRIRSGKMRGDVI